MNLRARLALVLCGLAFSCGYYARQDLFNAVRTQDENRVRTLIRDGVDVNTESHLGVSAMDLAAGQRDSTIVRILLMHGAELTEPHGELALRSASTEGSPESVRLLLEAGADPNARYYLGGTILMQAVEAGRLDTVTVLLDHGADPNLRGRYGRRVEEIPCGGTPLILASRGGHVEIVRQLLLHGAGPDAADESHCTPMSIARGAPRQEIVSLLQAAMNTLAPDGPPD